MSPHPQKNQALKGLVFIYWDVWQKSPGTFRSYVRAECPAHLPAVLNPTETRAVRAHLPELYRVTGMLLSRVLWTSPRIRINPQVAVDLYEARQHLEHAAWPAGRQAQRTVRCGRLLDRVGDYPVTTSQRQ